MHFTHSPPRPSAVDYPDPMITHSDERKWYVNQILPDSYLVALYGKTEVQREDVEGAWAFQGVIDLSHPPHWVEVKRDGKVVSRRHQIPLLFVEGDFFLR